MRVVSKFKDYYDPVLRLYQDELTPLYKRELKEIPNFSDAVMENLLRENFYLGFFKMTERAIIGFCGKLYVSWKHEDKWIYDIDIIQKDVNKSKFNISFFGQHSIKDMVKQIEVSKEYLSYFEKYKTPCFVILKDGRDSKLILNPKLEEYNFQTIIDPYSATQELNVFLNSGIMGESEPEPNVNDKIIRDSKGFDDKSFKSESGLKKKRRKENKQKKRKG